MDPHRRNVGIDEGVIGPNVQRFDLAHAYLSALFLSLLLLSVFGGFLYHSIYKLR
jgi:hypothetical protein